MSQFTKELPTVPIVPVWWFFFFLWVYTNIKTSLYWREHLCSLASYNSAEEDWLSWVLLSALGQFFPCLSNGGNTGSQVQRQCSKRNIGARAAGKTPCRPPECYFVTLPIAYYQGQHIVITPKGRSLCLRSRERCKGTSPAGRDAIVSSCGSLEGGSGVQLCPAHPAPCCHLGCTHPLRRNM